MDLVFVQRIVWTSGVFVGVLLVGAQFQRHLVRRYPFFTSYLIVQVFASILLMQVEYNSPAYLNGWRWYTAAMILLRAGLAGELFERLLSHFKGIGRFRFWMGGILLALTGLVGGAVFQPLTPALSFPHSLVTVIARWETFAIAVSFILSSRFLSRFVGWRPELAPNVRIHWKLLVVYFSIDSLGSADLLLAGSLAFRMVENILMLAGEIACTVAWLVLFSSAGEIVPVRQSKYTEEEAAEVIRRDREIHSFITGLPDEIGRRQARN